MPQTRVDLLLIGENVAAFRWPLGSIHHLGGQPDRIGPAIDAWVAQTDAAFALVWNPRLGPPELAVVQETLQLPGDVWHAGLRLGTAGHPRLLDCVEPVWMLNRDPDAAIVATSWRLSFDACLVRVDVIRQLGGIDSCFETLTGSSLDAGYRWLRRGAIVRHVPALVGDAPFTRVVEPTLHDELRFIRQHHGRKWFRWSLWRALASGYSLRALISAARRIQHERLRPEPMPYRRDALSADTHARREWSDTVSVVIPTLDRYSYLRAALDQLRVQTIRPREIIVVDQTPQGERDDRLTADYADLPLRVYRQDTLGQCTARNKALAESSGEFLLFMDDDTDEIPPDFIERLLRTADHLGADFVASSVEEAGAGPTPEAYRLMRVIDIFPVGTLVRRSFLEKSGLFDYAFDRGARADADVAMRGYLAGALMMLDPAVRIAHWRAARGGLRVHGARVITTASSRVRLTHRDVPSQTELYLVMRHFTARQLREMEWQRIVGTFAAKGNLVHRFVKAIVSAAYLPLTVWQIRRNARLARAMLVKFPQIPMLSAGH